MAVLFFVMEKSSSEEREIDRSIDLREGVRGKRIYRRGTVRLRKRLRRLKPDSWNLSVNTVVGSE